MKIEKSMLTLNDVAKLFGVSRTTVYDRLLVSDDFPRPVMLGGSVRRWRADELTAYVERMSEARAA